MPIDGEAGVGYRMRSGYELPPLMFSTREAQALVASVRLAQSRIDTELAARAEDALSKILAVLPADERAAAERLSIYAPAVRPDTPTRLRLAQLRHATDLRFKIRLEYVDLSEAESRRVVRPLACFFWGEAWTLAAWCEVREDFRNFRVDRIRALDVLDERFRDEPGRTLADLRRSRRVAAMAFGRLRPSRAAGRLGWVAWPPCLHFATFGSDSCSCSRLARANPKVATPRPSAPLEAATRSRPAAPSLW